MAYDAKDKSVAQGAPVEFYKFTGDFGVYRYTTDNIPGTCNGEIYLPVEGGISRSAIELTTAVDNLVTCDIMLPADNPVAQSVAFKQNPDVWEVEIRRAHRGDDWASEWSLEWWGFGLGSSVSGDIATLQTGDAIQQFFGRTIPNVTYKRSCNHKLYDARCKVDIADWTLTTSVIKVQASFVTVDNDQAANDALAGGQAVVPRTGETRPILRNTDNVIKIAYPFIDIEPGDEIKLIFGCDHSKTGDCLQRFNNVINYGGFDDIPSADPFEDLTFDQIVTETVNSSRLTRPTVWRVSGGKG